jgi:hypothetical protein
MSRVPRSFAAFALTFALVALVATGASAEARRALIVGINDYREIPPLQKAVGDADALKATLESLGFTVDLVLNADRRELNRAVSSFQSSLQPGDTALIHFSGHGVEIDGQNYLLPADIPKPQSGQQDFIKSEAVSLGDLMQRIAASGASTRIFIVDACRDNPFASSGGRGLGGPRGLTLVDPPAGSFVLYSAGYQQSALDRLSDTDEEPTSVYTRVLTKRLLEPGVQLAVLAQEVRSDVEALAKSVGHVQRPAYYDELSGQFFFKQAAAEGPKPAPQQATPPPAPLPQLPSLNEREAFDAAKDIGSDAAWDAFLKRFPQGFYADMARAARDKLARASEPATPVPEPTPPAPLEPQSSDALQGDTELNTDRPGFDYRNFDLTAADANPCRAQCEAETQCLSWTYVAPGVQGVNARCWLKKAVPQQMANGCCISGVKRLGPPRVASIGNARGVASSYWSHNGSSLYLMAEGDRRRFYYETPRPGMAGQGVERGTLLFDGQKVGNNYQGTAYVFDRQCGKFPYAVSGAVTEGSPRIVLYGRAPEPDASCKIGGYRVDTLVFDYKSAGKP